MRMYKQLLRRAQELAVEWAGRAFSYLLGWTLLLEWVFESSHVF